MKSEENITPRKEHVLMNLKTEKRKKVTLKKLR